MVEGKTERVERRENKREGEWRGERERESERRAGTERERERRKWLVVTHARFFRQTAFLKIFPPVAACRFKSPGRSRRFSNAPNTACTSLRRAPPIATASNIFFPFFIRFFFIFSPPPPSFFPLFFFYSTPSFPYVPLVSRSSLNFQGEKFAGTSEYFFFFLFHETRWNSIPRLEKSPFSHRLIESPLFPRVRRVPREIRIREKCILYD